MPLTARVKDTGEVVCILDIPNPSSKFVKGEVVCPYCEAGMTVVTGGIRVNHFRHLPGPACSDPYADGGDPETAAHIVGKSQIYRELKALYPESQGYGVVVEHPLPEVGRRADVVVFHPNGWAKAYEIQLSAISHTTLEERTRDYEAAGLNVCWVLGESAKTKTNLEWSIERFGKAYSIVFERVLSEQPLSKEG